MCGARSLEQVALTKAHRPRSPHATGTSFVEANDNALPLRGLVYRAVRLAGRLALTQLRSIVNASWPVAPSLGANGLRVVQRGPRAVCEVRSTYPLSVSAGHLVALQPEAQQTSDGVREECTGSSEIVHRSTAQ